MNEEDFEEQVSVSKVINKLKANQSGSTFNQKNKQQQPNKQQIKVNLPPFCELTKVINIVTKL